MDGTGTPRAPGPARCASSSARSASTSSTRTSAAALYPWPSTPLIPGAEAAGVVAEIGAGVTDLKVGDRVAYTLPVGAYRTQRVVAAERLVKLPDAIAFDVAASVDAQGIDGAISAHLVLSGQGGRHRAGACGGRRRRLAAGTVAEVTGRDMRSGRRDRPRRRQSPRPTAIPTSSTIAPRISSPASRRSPVPGAAMWFTIRSARTPGAARSNRLRPRGMFVHFGQSSGMIADFKFSDLASGGSLVRDAPDACSTTSRAAKTSRRVPRISSPG